MSGSGSQGRNLAVVACLIAAGIAASPGDAATPEWASLLEREAGVETAAARAASVLRTDGRLIAAVAATPSSDDRYYELSEETGKRTLGREIRGAGRRPRGRAPSASELQARFREFPSLGRTLLRVQQLRRALDSFWVDNGGYPAAGAPRLLEPGTGTAPALHPHHLEEPVLTDGWGFELEYEPTGDRVLRPWVGNDVELSTGYRIRSLGPDGRAGGGDDLVFDSDRGDITIERRYDDAE
jgi:hypothetical protein